MNHHPHPNLMPFGLVLLAIILAGVGGIMAAALIIAAERKPAPTVHITNDTIPRRVIDIHSDSIDVRYSIHDINQATR